MYYIHIVTDLASSSWGGEIRSLGGNFPPPKMCLDKTLQTDGRNSDLNSGVMRAKSGSQARYVSWRCVGCVAQW